MRQRVMIPIAFCSGLKLLLADEPTTALDVTIQDQVMKLINRLWDQLKMSVILITHDLGVVAQMCDRVAVMYAGQIVEITDTRALLYMPRHPYTYALMSSLPGAAGSSQKRLPTIEGARPNLPTCRRAVPLHPAAALPKTSAGRKSRSCCPTRATALTTLPDGRQIACHFPLNTDSP